MRPNMRILTAVVLTAAAAAVSVTGCELIATVDRSKIAGAGTGGAGTGGAGTGGAGGTTVSSTSSTGGTGGASTSSTSSTGGACGGGTTCTVGDPQSCPAPATECSTRTCDTGCCGTSNVQGGTATMNGQTAGDCMQQVCDGNGGVMMQNDDNDVPDDSNPCTADSCNNGAAVHAPMAGTCMIGSTPGVCGDPAGAAKGTCVACNTSADCTSPMVCDTTANMCVAASCADNMKDGSETDKDCGGTCGGCAVGLVCSGNTDCLSSYCKAGICTAPTCSDSAINGNETDTDCGGTGFGGQAACPKCADTKKCAANSDCVNSFCDLTAATPTCKTPSCTDGQKNGTETGLDCGGSTCDMAGKTCAVGLACVNATDCTSGFCNSGLCALKPIAAACGVNAECASTFCADGVCCNNACNSGCNSCDLTGTVGTCSPVAANNNPVTGKTTCTTTAQDTCGTNGKCDGAGACQDWPSTTACGTAACVGNTSVLDGAVTCDGSGACAMPTTTDCAPYNCAAGACNTTCASNSDCSTGNVCNSGVCGTTKGAGAACATDNECGTGFCTDGVCCQSACAGTCMVCGAGGVCAPVAQGQSDTSPACSGASACDGAGNCLAASGQDCAQGTDCASGTCNVDDDAGLSSCQ